MLANSQNIKVFKKIKIKNKKVELSITKCILTTEHFPIFSSLLDHIFAIFYVSKRMSVIVCFKFFEKLDLDSSLVPASYFSHF